MHTCEKLTADYADWRGFENEDLLNWCKNPCSSAFISGKNFACGRGSSLRSEYKKLNLQFHYRRARAAFVLLRLGHGVHMRMVF